MEKIKKHWQVADLMVEGLRKEWVNVDMKSFGYEHNGVFCGCAATNALCQALGRVLTKEELQDGPGSMISSTHKTLNFAWAVNALRQGDLRFYGLWIKESIPAIRDMPSIWLKTKLPVLISTNFRDGLPAYEKFRDNLKLANI